MNALNGAWSDTSILQIITQQELQKLTKVLQRNLILKVFIMLNIFSSSKTPRNLLS